MQFVFQDPYASLHPRQTVDDILREPLIIHGIDDRDERMMEAIAEVGLSADTSLPLSAPIVGRPTAAGGHCPGTDPEAADPVAG